MSPASPRLRALVLGSGAGGGVPQWNCGCRVCRLAWSGDQRVKPRTQAGLALTVDGANWVLLNASIDLRQQILATPALHPKGEGRHSPIGAVVLTNAEVDSSAGLLALRERQPLVLFGTQATLDAIGANRMFDVVDRAVAPRRAVRLGEPFEPLPGIKLELFAVPGKVPLWLEEGNVSDRRHRRGHGLRRGGSGGQADSSMRPAAPMLRRTSTPASPMRTCCFSTARCSPTTK